MEITLGDAKYRISTFGGQPAGTALTLDGAREVAANVARLSRRTAYIFARETNNLVATAEFKGGPFESVCITLEP